MNKQPAGAAELSPMHSMLMEIQEAGEPSASIAQVELPPENYNMDFFNEVSKMAISLKDGNSKIKKLMVDVGERLKKAAIALKNIEGGGEEKDLAQKELDAIMKEYNARVEECKQLSFDAKQYISATFYEYGFSAKEENNILGLFTYDNADDVVLSGELIYSYINAGTPDDIKAFIGSFCALDAVKAKEDLIVAESNTLQQESTQEEATSQEEGTLIDSAPSSTESKKAVVHTKQSVDQLASINEKLSAFIFGLNSVVQRLEDLITKLEVLIDEVSEKILHLSKEDTEMEKSVDSTILGPDDEIAPALVPPDNVEARDFASEDAQEKDVEKDLADANVVKIDEKPISQTGEEFSFFGDFMDPQAPAGEAGSEPQQNHSR